MLTDFTSLIGTLVRPATPVAKSIIERNALVIKLLKHFKLDPEHPPSDFTGVYRYAFVEYGIEKPEPALKLFNQEEIQNTFREAFEHDLSSLSSLMSEHLESFLEWNIIGDEIRESNIDPRRELAEFSAVFIEVTKRTRTPKEVLHAHTIERMQQDVRQIRKHLASLENLEEIQDAIVQLVEGSKKGLSSSESSSRGSVLAQQMQDWFNALRYEFESHEIWEENYFEWAIHVPSWRGYDRILVRGIEGKAEIHHVQAFSQSIELQRADGGWLVAARMISPAAHRCATENRNIVCYTFDELIDQVADFERYFNWLEEEIRHRGIDTMYVPLGCTKDEIDPLTNQKIEVSRYGEEEGGIDNYIDRWLDDPAKEHISILGEFGTGKTWFAFYYAWIALKRYQEKKKDGTNRPRLPLVIPLRDYAKAVSVESLFSEFFFRKHEIRQLNYSAFEQLNRMGKLLLIFDGFDEMAARVDRQKTVDNFWELAKVVVPGAKAILTCRTEHFFEAKEGRKILSAEIKASTSNLTGEAPQFEVLELEKFNDKQIRQLFSFRAKADTVERILGNPELLDLARRPVMADLILEAMPDIEEGKPIDMSRIYLYAVRRKMQRDISSERTFTSLADKLYFLCEVAREMLATSKMSLNYRLFPERIRHLFRSAVQEERDLDHWHHDMMGNTMLIRNAEGDYFSAHRSLLEFFFAYKLAAELGGLATDFLELSQAQSHINEPIESQLYTWSDYFQRQVDATGAVVPIARLKAFTRESLVNLNKTCGQARLTAAVIDLILPMLDKGDATTQRLLTVIEETRGKAEEEVGYVGGNVTTLLLKRDRTALEGKDLSHVVIKGADFTNASLQNTNMTEATLEDSMFTRVLGSIRSVAHSPNRKLIAAGGVEGVVHVWELPSGRELLTLQGHEDTIYTVAFSPDGKTLASGSVDQTVRLWDLTTGNCIKVLVEHEGWVRAVAFSPDGKTLASGSVDQTVRLWDLTTGNCTQTFNGHKASVYTVVFSPNQQILASGSDDCTVRLWELNTGKCIQVLKEHSKTVRAIAFSPDGQTLASGSEDATIRLWKLSVDKSICVLQEHEAGVYTIAFNLDGQTLASGGAEQTVRLWDLTTGKCVQTFEGHRGTVRGLAFSSSDKTFISGGEDSTIRLWNLSTGKCTQIFRGFWGAVRAIAFSPDQQILASGSEDSTVRLWDLTGRRTQSFDRYEASVNAVAFSPNQQLLASGSDDQVVRLWEISTGKCIKTLQEHEETVRAVAFSPDGQILVSGGADKTARLWEVSTGRHIQALEGHQGTVYAVAFNSNGQTLASGSFDAVVRLWDLATGQCVQVFEEHRGAVRAIAFNPNGQTLASGSDDRTVRLWEISTGKRIEIFEDHQGWVRTIAFNPSGEILASGGDDRMIRLWRVSTGECVGILKGHQDIVRAVDFSANGQILASGSADQAIKLWDVETGKCLKTFINKPCAGMNITGTVGLTQGQKVALIALGAVKGEADES
jgi:WD40 repeat protein